MPQPIVALDGIAVLPHDPAPDETVTAPSPPKGNAHHVQRAYAPAMNDLEVRIADAEREREDAFAVRREVFVEEQGVDEDMEYDEHDETATHFVAYDGDEPIGAARLREYEADVGKVERVAVLESRRKTGVGRALMQVLEERAEALGFPTLKLHSQTRAADFYRSLGYERRGDEFEEAGIPHVEMRKSL